MNTAEQITLRILCWSNNWLTVRDIIEQRSAGGDLADEQLTYESLHVVLQQLESRKFVVSMKGEPLGLGLLRRYYRVTRLGRDIWSIHRG
jgi:predicted transcriptional regulator